jgi:hypothetical protein
MRDRRLDQRKPLQTAIGNFDRLFDSQRNFHRFAVSPADAAVPVSDHDKRRETKSATTLNDASTASNLNNFFRIFGSTVARQRVSSR